jgi:hypothetical protein
VQSADITCLCFAALRENFCIIVSSSPCLCGEIPVLQLCG